MNVKYVALQLMLKHKEECHSKKCSDCDFIARNKQETKRHMRDDHGVITGSTSPPLKRKRGLIEKEEIEEKMDVENEDDLEDLSLKLEDLDIEFMDFEEEDILVERSDNNDEKVREYSRDCGWPRRP